MCEYLSPLSNESRKLQRRGGKTCYPFRVIITRITITIVTVITAIMNIIITDITAITISTTITIMFGVAWHALIQLLEIQ